MTAFSPKQRTVLTWWVPGNPNRGKEAIVCDGAVRSGKTLAMGLSFFLWAMSCFREERFGICGKTIASLRRNIGIIQQDVYMFAGTVRENIRYGRPDATDAEIAEASKRAEIYDDIMAMPQGFDTYVGERGTMLSGGQKQRISIARVFLKNPSILILDEATSALDNATEMLIQQSLSELAKGRTCIIVAHRLSTIKNADEIIVLTKDGIEERGTHDELIAQHGKYYQLYTGDFEEND